MESQVTILKQWFTYMLKGTPFKDVNGVPLVGFIAKHGSHMYVYASWLL